MNTILEQALLAVADFYAAHGRALPWRQDRDAYHVWLSEIMLQQTRVEAVIPYYERFLARFPTVFALAEAPEEALLKEWEGLGYYSRARNLHRTAKEIATRYGGHFPPDLTALLALKGVGEYTAAAIGSIAFGLPTAPVDGNVLRIYARLFAHREDVTDPRFKKAVREALNAVYPSGDRASQVTQGLMEVGQCFCTPSGVPHCSACPLLSLCRTGREGGYANIPYRAPKKPRRVLQLTVLLLHVAGEGKGRFFIRRRADEGLLGGLWELPSIECAPSEEAALAFARELGVTPLAAMPTVSGKHVFTHLEWHMQGFLVECAEQRVDGLTLATVKELKEKYPIPTAFRVFKDLILEEEKKG